MTTLSNDRLIRALFRQPVDRTPVWMMRQAGRYLPEYRALRAKVPDFMTFCKTPALACEVTVQPLARFPLDAAIIFSDILVVPDALGLPVSFLSGEGPVFEQPIRNASGIKALSVRDAVGRLDYVLEAIQKTRQELAGRVPLIGFAGSPWTVATYMVEGRSSKVFFDIKKMLYTYPALLHALLEVLTEVTIDYLNAQIDAGVDVIMLFDTWGGMLTPAAYRDFSLRYLQAIAAGLKREHAGRKIPVVFFTKQGGQWLETMAAAGPDALGIDWTTDIANARERVGNQVALQGNLDPMVLCAQPDYIEQAVLDILEAYGPGPGHVFNLGHGILPQTPIEGVEAMISAVQRYGVHSAGPMESVSAS